jgi:hypothetical protein
VTCHSGAKGWNLTADIEKKCLTTRKKVDLYMCSYWSRQCMKIRARRGGGGEVSERVGVVSG